MDARTSSKSVMNWWRVCEWSSDSCCLPLLLPLPDLLSAAALPSFPSSVDPRNTEPEAQNQAQARTEPRLAAFGVGVGAFRHRS